MRAFFRFHLTIDSIPLFDAVSDKIDEEGVVINLPAMFLKIETGGFRIVQPKERWIDGVRKGASKGGVVRGVHCVAVI
jgi:hypothetical protein